MLNKDTEINHLKQQYGSVKWEDKEYVLKQNAYIDGTKEESYYTACCIDDEFNEYIVFWEIINKEAEDESDACDWTNPYKMLTDCGRGL